LGKVIGNKIALPDMISLLGSNWNPVLESHQPLRFCKPPPELLGQRDEN
jgi:hypothetical protein